MVELVIIDEFPGKSNHPMHLHGYKFQVLALEKLNGITEAQFKKLDSQGKIKRNLNDPPQKDTIMIPNGGYAIIRIFSSNPGGKVGAFLRLC